ncbi:Stp1/IreP family PP2C-type Ser/Thr phosphatase [Bacillus horti]|uniref:Protein phosphatase n=1 Tax=Caldalkalibacillus horti TaxID=77523 RepID=A0ABT9VXI9_9BACI|nr:protein phosphatase [Bacillus horti]
MEVVLKTHIGRVRQVNEDTAEVVKRESNTTLVIVADGMGGHQAGDVASQLAVKYVKQAFMKAELHSSAVTWEEWLIQTISETNRYIYDYAEQDQAYQGMGTTIVTSLFLEDYYIVAHVGDSRIYRYEQEQQQLTSITEDHSLVNELVKSGEITKAEADVHPQRSWITRSLGTQEDVKVDVKTMGYLGDECILLCSDGLSDMINEQHMLDILKQDKGLEEKASELIDAALEAGGDDNITLCLVQPTSSPSAQEER